MAITASAMSSVGFIASASVHAPSIKDKESMPPVRDSVRSELNEASMVKYLIVVVNY
jgi:hypothetical protein